MGDKTTANETLSREETADRLQALASELRGDGPANVTVGNKVVTLTPSESPEYEITVEERSPMLGRRREEVTIELEWGVETDS
ncbi:amphi-Trp domain-containing protein [Halobacteria archaeon AArc-curdl1]|uniref:Amphi-Trp domain-containing protein n=1 Tax=Natronosalvus hydrolyticus TaxID=2979988 RepID=A0AAP2ZBR1_9EURY|nr:amphi-Trp domain-containing protein [Halobacteria archaeon AArc-curdl1]